KKMLYKNIVLIFPTISLLSENLQRIIGDPFFKDYKKITLSDEKIDNTNNLLIFTPERFMSFIDKNQSQNFDFIFMDELYKIDNEYISNEENTELSEANRDITFRIALEMGLRRTKDCLLVGPYLN